MREMILATRQTVAQGVNSALVMLYWKIGERIRVDILRNKRAGWGEKIVDALSRQLSADSAPALQKKNFEIPKEGPAEYGKKILPTLSAKLVPELGQGFGPRNLAQTEVGRFPPGDVARWSFTFADPHRYASASSSCSGEPAQPCL